jgi:hypothetical protein
MTTERQHSEKTRKKLSDAMKRIVRTPEHRAKLAKVLARRRRAKR